MLQHLGLGLRRIRAHKKSICFLYLGNLSVALLLAVPFLHIFENSLGPGLYREQMAGDLDYDWYRLFQERTDGYFDTFSPEVIGVGPFARQLESLLDGGLTGYPWEILTVGGLYLLLTAFLSASAVGSLVLDPRGTSTREFFRTGATLFGRFFRLGLLSLFCFWVLNHMIIEPSSSWVNLKAESALTDREAFLWQFSRYPLILLVVLYLKMLFDYAKIKTALEDRTSVILAFLSATRFCLAHSLSVFSFYLLIVSIGLLGVFVYTGLEGWNPQHSEASWLVGLVFQQIYMVFRLSLRLLFFSGQAELYLSRENL